MAESVWVLIVIVVVSGQDPVIIKSKPMTFAVCQKAVRTATWHGASNAGKSTLAAFCTRPEK